MSTIDQILSEFIDAWNAGQRPRVREYLRRVPEGPQRDELAQQLSTWLEMAPTPTFSEATRDAIRAEPIVQDLRRAADEEAGLWPSVLPVLRARAGLSVSDLAGRLLERLRLPAAQRERTGEYLERLEGGELDPTRVSRRLLDALGGVLGIGGLSLADAGLLGGGLRPVGGGATLFRASEGDDVRWVAEDIEVLSQAALTPAPEMDELDRLFTGGPDG
jgi:hypothetical protein